MNNWMGFSLLALVVGLLVAILLWLAASPALPQATAPAAILRTLFATHQATPNTRPLDIQRWETSRGSRVLFVAAPELPMFELRLVFAAGSSQDGGFPGLAVLTNALLNEGTPTKNTTQIAEGFEQIGVQLSNQAYRDMGLVALRSLSFAPERTAALALLTEILKSPSFPEEPLERIKNQLLASFEQLEKTPGALANIAFFETLYANHPYAHPSEGTAQSIRTITPKMLHDFYQKAYTSQNATIVLVGALSPEQARAIAEQVSQALPQGPALPKIVAATGQPSAHRHIEFASSQATIVLGQIGISRAAPEFPAVFLANHILGGSGFGSRLMQALREERGLTYSVYSAVLPMQANGPFMISLQTRAQLSEGTLALVQRILGYYLETGPTEAELDQAKREISGSLPLSTASNSQIADQLGMIGFYELPTTYIQDFLAAIEAQTTSSVTHALQKILSMNAMHVVTLGPTVAQEPIPEANSKRFKPSFGVPEH